MPPRRSKKKRGGSKTSNGSRKSLKNESDEFAPQDPDLNPDMNLMNVIRESLPPVGIPVQRRKPCPRGTHYNKVTGICEPNVNKTQRKKKKEEIYNISGLFNDKPRATRKKAQPNPYDDFTPIDEEATVPLEDITENVRESLHGIGEQSPAPIKIIPVRNYEQVHEQVQTQVQEPINEPFQQKPQSNISLEKVDIQSPVGVSKDVVNDEYAPQIHGTIIKKEKIKGCIHGKEKVK